MSMIEQIYAQALLLAGQLDERQEALLQVLCRGAVSSLAARLRLGLTPEDCGADFVSAASLYALAALWECDEGQISAFSVGDVTVSRSGGVSAAGCLRRQAELVMAPYLQPAFSFKGV